MAQDVLPGRPLYHAGWFNVMVAGIAIYAVLQLRRTAKSDPARPGLAVAVFGTAVVAFAGVAAGLLGPDSQTVVGAPGASVRVPNLPYALDFPLVTEGAPAAVPRRRYSANFILDGVGRSVVFVSALDPHGNHLTITQPSGTAFLSPVLLMQSNTSIAGMTVPFDTFAVPAARRSVKAVLFTKQQAGQLRTRLTLPGQAAVLFAVSGPNDRIVPGGISIVTDGGQKSIGGLTLRARVIEYPAYEVSSAPNGVALLAGLAILASGIVLLRRRAA